MRVRALDTNGDMRFGRSAEDFFVNDKRGVAQNVETRLALYLGEWFLDTTAGTPWRTEVLGKRTNATRDPALRARILGTAGVVSVGSFASQLNRATRAYSVQVAINTAYGQTIVATSLNLPNQDVRYAR